MFSGASFSGMPTSSLIRQRDSLYIAKVLLEQPEAGLGEEPRQVACSEENRLSISCFPNRIAVLDAISSIWGLVTSNLHC